MASDVLTVLLEGKPIGNVERLASGALRLGYDEGYRDDPTATLLSVSMPSAEAVHGDARLTPWLWGLLPDNADVLARWGRDFGVSSDWTGCNRCIGTQRQFSVRDSIDTRTRLEHKNDVG